MKSNYKQAFDAIRMPPERQEQIRSELSARIYEKPMEDNIVNIKSRSTKKLVAVLVAAILAVSLSTFVAFAYGDQIIQLLGGGQIKSGITEEGSHYTSMTMSTDDPAPVEVRDGKVYFVLDGTDTDITGYCTETTYYQYEKNADNGYRHIFIVGGSPDDLGWAEYIWDEAGKPVGSTSVLPAGYNADEKPIWLELADEAFQS